MVYDTQIITIVYSINEVKQPAYITGFPHIVWLVVSIPLTNMKINWDDEFPKIWTNNPNVHRKPVLVFNLVNLNQRFTTGPQLDASVNHPDLLARLLGGLPFEPLQPEL